MPRRHSGFSVPKDVDPFRRYNLMMNNIFFIKLWKVVIFSMTSTISISPIYY